jgi:hypothetical protein
MPDNWWTGKLREINQGMEMTNERIAKLWQDPNYIRTDEGQATIQGILDNAQFGGIIAGQRAKLFPKARQKFSALWDNLMRFEIDDSKMKVRGVLKGAQKLGELIDHPELFKNYPELKNVPVRVSRLPIGKEFKTLGQASGSGIRLFTREGKKVLDRKELGSLMHEVQHIIQDFEGFAQGGTPEAMIRKVEKMKQLLERAKQSDPMYLRAWSSLKSGKISLNDFYSLPDVRRYNTKNITAEKLYRQLAGEIEARDVVKRLGLSARQRSAIAPYSSERLPVSEWITEGIGKIHEMPR